MLTNFEDCSGINGVGFGQETAATGEVTDAGGVEPRDAHAGFPAGAQEGVFVASCGFAHDVELGVEAVETLEPSGDGFRGVLDLRGHFEAVAEELEAVFGDIDSEEFDAVCGLVHGLEGLTHPCITSLARGIDPHARSGNCSS